MVGFCLPKALFLINILNVMRGFSYVVMPRYDQARGLFRLTINLKLNEIASVSTLKSVESVNSKTCYRSQRGEHDIVLEIRMVQPWNTLYTVTTLMYTPFAFVPSSYIRTYNVPRNVPTPGRRSEVSGRVEGRRGFFLFMALTLQGWSRPFGNTGPHQMSRCRRDLRIDRILGNPSTNFKSLVSANSELILT